MTTWTPNEFIYAVTSTIVASVLLTMTLTSVAYTIADWIDRLVQSAYKKITGEKND